MQNLKDLSANQILDSYDFSERFCRKYLIAVAKALMYKVEAKDQDPRSLKAITVAEAYLEGRALEKELAKAFLEAKTAKEELTSQKYLRRRSLRLRCSLRLCLYRFRLHRCIWPQRHIIRSY